MLNNKVKFSAVIYDQRSIKALLSNIIRGNWFALRINLMDFEAAIQHQYHFVTRGFGPKPSNFLRPSHRLQGM